MVDYSSMHGFPCIQWEAEFDAAIRPHTDFKEVLPWLKK